MILLSEIMANSTYWQAIRSREPVKFGANFREYHNISRNADYLNLYSLGQFARNMLIIVLSGQINLIIAGSATKYCEELNIDNCRNFKENKEAL